jgi:hypothetical protein
MRIDTGCDSSAAFKALVSPPPVQSAETRSFEAVVAEYAGQFAGVQVAGLPQYCAGVPVAQFGQLQLWCNGCGQTHNVKVTPEQVRATSGDFAKLLPQLASQNVNCPYGAVTGQHGLSAQFHPNHPHPHPHVSIWQKFFNKAWASLKASDERAMAEHSTRNIFGLV